MRHHRPSTCSLGAGAARNGGRWNAPGVPALYMSATHSTAIAEYMQSLVRPGTLVAYQVRSAAILDVTDLDVRTRVGINETLLTLDWRHVRDIHRGTPPSWDFAGQAIAAGVDGMRVRSVQNSGHNLVLWRWGEQGAEVELIDPFVELAFDQA